MILVSVVLPCMNEEKNIMEMYKLLSKEFEKINKEYEIIYVDDGSKDNSLSVLKELSEKDTRVKYISFLRNFGHQKALKAGIDMSQGDCVISLDADMQHPVNIIQKMISEWEKGFQIVYCQRSNFNEMSFIKRIFSNFFYYLISKLSQVEIHPHSSDMRLIDKQVVEELRKNKDYFLFLRGQLNWYGFSQTGVYYVEAPRMHGRSKYSWKKLYLLFLDAITSMSILPLRISSSLGFLVIIFAIFFAFFTLYEYFFEKIPVSGWTTLVLLITFLGGVQLFILGVIGEYLGKMYFESKQNPQYIVKETNIRRNK